METMTVHAEPRTDFGKGFARKLRASGRVPAVAYSGGRDALALSLDPRELDALRRQPLGMNTPLTLSVGSDTHSALVKEVVRHPVSRVIEHVDLRLLADGEQVVVKVPITTSGRSPGVALGGKLRQSRRVVRLRCELKDIPAAVNIDLSTLQLGQKWRMSEIALPAGCTLADHDFSVIVCKGRVAKEQEVKEELVFL